MSWIAAWCTRGMSPAQSWCGTLIRERLVQEAWEGGDEEVAGVLTIV